MKTVLLTGFEPFGGERTNPSQAVVHKLHGGVIRRHRIEGAVLPCAFRDSLAVLRGLIRRHDPTVVICLGQAGGRAAITPERVAINIDDARIPDNAGQQPVDRPVVRGGPAAYFSTLPIKAMVRDLRAAGLPAEVSQTAGTFVCNHVFYGLMHALRERPSVRGGFIHLPWLSGQGAPALDPAAMETGIRLAIAAALRCRRDVRLAGGRLH
ncbi:MAG: pyroglutamyl-peptidase I [Opitutaceae bacterium]|nr:pyroglutamyl-peptidase I [Opitutaceae bacterium]